MSTKSNSRITLLRPGSEATSPYLELLSGKDKGKLLDVTVERLTIGRNDNNDIVVPSDAVSRYHAVLEKSEEGAFYIKDNQSKNGVQVNGKTVGEARLSNGDVVQVGNFVFRFNESSSPALASAGNLALANDSGYPDVAPTSSKRG